MAIAAAIACAGCGGVAPIAMHRVEAVRADPQPGEGVVVFVRPADPCARGGSFTIVDEHGEYVGEAATESQFAVAVPEGDHSFYSWDPYGEVRLQRAPDTNQVGAIRVHVEGHHPAFVLVTTEGGAFAVRKSCGDYRWVQLRQVGRNDAELDDWLRETKPYAPEHDKGQRWLDANAAETKRHVELGAKKLEQREERAKSSP